MGMCMPVPRVLLVVVLAVLNNQPSARCPGFHMPDDFLAVPRLALRRRGLLGGQTPSVVANVTSKVGSVDDNKSGGGYACEQLCSVPAGGRTAALASVRRKHGQPPHCTPRFPSDCTPRFPCLQTGRASRR